MAEEIKTILIAEDEEDLREMYSMALKGGGFDVLQAENGLKVFDWLEKIGGKVDLVLLDIVMPQMDGFETLEKMRKDERYRKLPVIVSTNLDNDEDRTQALGLGAKEYFVKSRHTPSELVAKVKEVFLEMAK